MSNYNLPSSPSLRIHILAGFFNNVSASYKYVFFLSVLHLAKKHQFKPVDLPFPDIEHEMLKIAWYPHTFYKLNFGYSDQLGIILEDFTKKMNYAHNDDINDLESKLKQYLKSADTTLLNMVPYRLINHFVDEPGYRKNDDLDVIRYANDCCSERKPLYSFKVNRKTRNNAVKIHPEWLEYIKTNYHILEGFVHWEWLTYMQKRNPNVLNIGEKLFPPDKRSSLALPTQFWKNIILNNKITCIYSGSILNDGNLSIDHYLPWSFLAHDREWNLVPVNKSINSSKSSKLPDNRYFDSFVKLQHLAIKAAPSIIKGDKYLENYMIDLKINDMKNLDLILLEKQYRQLYDPLFSIARNQGFEEGWVYS